LLLRISLLVGPWVFNSRTWIDRKKTWLILRASLGKSAYMLLVKLGQDERRQT